MVDVSYEDYQDLVRKLSLANERVRDLQERVSGREARIVALEAQIEQVTKKLNLAIAERDFWREADVNSQKQLFECKQSLVTPPAPKVTGAWRYETKYGPDGEANYAFVYDDGGHLVSNLKVHHAVAVVAAMNSTLTAAQEAGKP